MRDLRMDLRVRLSSVIITRGREKERKKEKERERERERSHVWSVFVGMLRF